MAISKYTRPIEQTLEQYVPLPFNEMLQAGSIIQQRGDAAEQQQMAVETGLASMEALAPAYSNFRDTFVRDYKAQAGALLDKYQGNTSNPDFIRASKKLNLTFASDPRLQTLKAGNELIKSQQKIAQELAAKGIKYIDPNIRFTGADANGRLITPSGSIRGTNFDEDLTKSFLQIKDNMIDNGRGWKTNKPNLDQLADNLTRNIETNPITRDAIDYYKQQGLSDQQARQATQGLIRQAYTDNLRTDRDYAYDQLQLARERHEWDKMEFKAKLDAKKQQGLIGLVPESSPIDAKNLNTDLIKGADEALKRLNTAGGLSRDKFVVDDTPENRRKYAGKFTEQTQTISGGTLGSAPYQSKQLAVQGSYNKDHIELLKTAREQLGNLAKNDKGSYLKDQTVIQRYKEFLERDNAAYTFWNTQSGDVLKQLDNVYVGSKGEKLGNASLVNSKGKVLKTAGKDFNIGDYDGFSFSGISAAPMEGFPNGAIKVSAVAKDGDDKGKIVQFLKPLDAQTASYFQATNKGYRALTSGKSNDQIAKDKSNYIPTMEGYFLLPQKNSRGSIDLFPVDANGNKLSNTSIPFEAYEQEERSNFNQYINVFSNKG